MSKLLYCALFAFVAFPLDGCHKPSNPEPENFFVKLFPEDEIYETTDCFQLSNGEYVIYGRNVVETGAPIIIKTDQNGNITGYVQLSNLYHFLTLKPLRSGGMMAVGFDRDNPDVINICILNSDGGVISSAQYEIDSLRVNEDYMPDFVEEEHGFTICAFAIINNKLAPYVFQIDKMAGTPVYTEIETQSTELGLRASEIGLRKDGYSIAGGVANPPFNDGVFYMRLDKSLNVLWDTIILENDIPVSIAGLSEDTLTGSTVICGSYGGSKFSGTLYAQKIKNDGSISERHSFYDYENEGRFRGMTQTSDGGYALAGTVNKLTDQNLVSYTKIYLLKLDPELTFEWSRTHNSEKPFTGVSVFQTSDGGYLIGGYEHSASYVNTMLMIKTDENGEIETLP